MRLALAFQRVDLEPLLLNWCLRSHAVHGLSNLADLIMRQL